MKKKIILFSICCFIVVCIGGVIVWATNNLILNSNNETIYTELNQVQTDANGTTIIVDSCRREGSNIVFTVIVELSNERPIECEFGYVGVKTKNEGNYNFCCVSIDEQTRTKIYEVYLSIYDRFIFNEVELVFDQLISGYYPNEIRFDDSWNIKVKFK